MNTKILDPLIEAQFQISKTIQDLRKEKEYDSVKILLGAKENIHKILLHYKDKE